MMKSVFQINKMDCPSEEQMIRMKLRDFPFIKRLIFYIDERRLTVIHSSNVELIEEALRELQLDSRLIESSEMAEFRAEDSGKTEQSVLTAVLTINFTLFLLEVSAGFLSGSMGLLADSLDMLADSIVYALSLYAVGRSVSKKKRIAKTAGYFQFFLAVMGFGEVIRRFFAFEQMPAFETMIIVSSIALAGNIASLLILQRSRDSGVHMKASWIFTSNDVIANLGVMLAGVLVYYTSSNRPDLIIGTIVFFLVARGAYRIYNLSK